MQQTGNSFIDSYQAVLAGADLEIYRFLYDLGAGISFACMQVLSANSSPISEWHRRVPPNGGNFEVQSHFLNLKKVVRKRFACNLSE